ncbi:MAG: hypothetical protein M1127_00945 [Patescibacteria group bacterium]|nr:hypothetical protein [Patescibacteria group bacterium]
MAIKTIRKKTIQKKVSSAKRTVKEVLAGQITHYFDGLGVAVVKLKAPLAAGDKIRIVGGEATDFKQTVVSMEIERKKIKKAGKGKEVGMKIRERAREGYKLYKLQ